MQDNQFVGLWWLPQQEDAKVAGTLSLDEGAGGGFVNTVVFGSASPSQGSCVAEETSDPVPYVHCDLGTLSGGNSATIRVTGRPTVPGTISTWVRALADEFELDRENNVALRTTAVLEANRPPVANAGGPYTVPEGGLVTLGGSGSDADGDILAFAWDLDNTR